MSYDPHAKIEAFLVEQMELGKAVLSAYNTVDPLQCILDEEMNPDEYLGYAARFIAVLREKESRINESRRSDVWDEFLTELVRRTFGPTQLVEGWVHRDAIREIATLIGESVTADARFDL